MVVEVYKLEWEDRNDLTHESHNIYEIWRKRIPPFPSLEDGKFGRSSPCGMWWFSWCGSGVKKNWTTWEESGGHLNNKTVTKLHKMLITCHLGENSLRGGFQVRWN